MAREEMRKRTYKFTKAQLIFYGSYANFFFLDGKEREGTGGKDIEIHFICFSNRDKC